MKKHIISIILLIVSLAVAMPGCSKETSQDGDKKNGYIFTDDLGRTVNVASHKRTAALLGSFADVWILSGGEVCASADDAWDDFNLELDGAVNLGGTKNLSLEALLSSNPDFVIASANTPQHIEWQSTLENAGITVAYFDINEFDDYIRMLKICTDINETPNLYEKYGVSVKENIDKILSEHEKSNEKTLVLRASAASIRAKGSDKTVLGAILTDFGCTNIADSDKTLLDDLSVEAITLLAPDRIFIIQSGDDIDATKKNIEDTFADNKLWSELDAVKNGRVYYMDKHLYNLKPNSRWDEAYSNVSDILYEDN